MNKLKIPENSLIVRIESESIAKNNIRKEIAERIRKNEFQSKNLMY